MDDRLQHTTPGDATAPSSGPAGRRPVIGIAGSREVVSFSWWTLPCDFMTSTYAEAVSRAGGRAVLLPPDPVDALHPEEVLIGLDGLLLPGGVDVDPANYDHEPHPALGTIVPGLDDIQLALTRAALAADLPLLGVCRGMQVLNVATGGTLHQHLPDLLGGSEDHRRIPGTLGVENAHDVSLEPGSLAAKAVGAEHTSTRSHHHQAIDTLGTGLVVSGHATDDGLIEAVEVPGAHFCLGVQWHPEADETSTVIAALVEAARLRIAEQELTV